MLPPLLALLPVPAVLLPEAAGAELLPDPEAAAAVLDGTSSVAVSTGVVETAGTDLIKKAEKTRLIVRDGASCKGDVWLDTALLCTYGAPFSTVKKEAMTRSPRPLFWT